MSCLCRRDQVKLADGSFKVSRGLLLAGLPQQEGALELRSQTLLTVPPKVCMDDLLSAGGIKSHSLSINSHRQLVPLAIVGLVGQ